MQIYAPVMEASGREQITQNIKSVAGCYKATAAHKLLVPNTWRTLISNTHFKLKWLFWQPHREAQGNETPFLSVHPVTANQLVAFNTLECCFSSLS